MMVIGAPGMKGEAGVGLPGVKGEPGVDGVGLAGSKGEPGVAGIPGLSEKVSSTYSMTE